MEKIRIDKKGWARCGNCGKKLFAITEEAAKLISEKNIGVEIKCHSCKKINAC